MDKYGKPILTRLRRQGRTPWADKDEELNEHRESARIHFLKYCDSGKCIREHIGLKRGENWHEGVCVECKINPYNMIVQ